ncbi:MAG: PKD domain-containing protein [Candidatus Thermoplasmatota archaeon]
MPRSRTPTALVLTLLLLAASGCMSAPSGPSTPSPSSLDRASTEPTPPSETASTPTSSTATLTPTTTTPSATVPTPTPPPTAKPTQAPTPAAPSARATIDATPEEGEAPLVVTFHVEAASGASWSLDFGDGNVTTGKGPDSIVHEYVSAGEHVARLVASEATNATAIVRVLAPQTRVDANLSASPLEGTAPLEVALFVSVHSTLGASSWALDFGDGSPPREGRGNADSLRVTHSYHALGAHEARLTAQEGNAGDSASVVLTIRAPEGVPPRVGLAVEPATGAAPLSVQARFDVSDSDDDLVSWSLEFGDGAILNGSTPAADQRADHTFAQAGEHVVRLLARDSAGHSNETSINVTVRPQLPPPLASLAAQNESGTTPLNVTFTAACRGEPPLSWDLDFGDGTEGLNGTGALENATFVHTYVAVGEQTARLVVRSGEAEASEGVTISVSARPNLPPQAAFGGTLTDNVLVLNAQASHDPEGEALSFAWLVGEQSFSGVSVQTRLATHASVQVILTVTDPEGGTGSATAAYQASAARAFVLLTDAGGGAGVLRVIDLPEGTESSSIALAGSPTEVAAGATTAFVSEDALDFNSVIVETVDLATGSVTHRVSFPMRGASHVFLEPTRERAWVVLDSSERVGWVTPDGASGTVQTTSPLGGAQGSGMGRFAFSADGHYAWKTNLGEGTVGRIDLTGDVPTSGGVVVTGAGAHAVAYNEATGIVVVANYDTRTLSFVLGSSMVVLSTAALPASPEQLACRSHGPTCVVGVGSGGAALVTTSSYGGSVGSVITVGSGAVADAHVTPDDSAFILSESGASASFLVLLDASTGAVTKKFDSGGPKEGGAWMAPLAGAQTWYAVRSSSSAREAYIYELNLPTLSLTRLPAISMPGPSWTVADVVVTPS